MFNLLPRLESEFPWLHKRSAREDDCHSFCKKHGVNVVFQHGVPHGVYAMAAGDHFIFLDPKLSGWMLLYVFCHEIGHYLFHSPSQSNMPPPSDAKKKLILEFFAGERKRKNHIEAEQVAALMLLPFHEIDALCEAGAYEVFPELGRLIKVREQCEKMLREKHL